MKNITGNPQPPLHQSFSTVAAFPSQRKAFVDIPLMLEKHHFRKQINVFTS